ncbi:15724_t:CDS:1, partial [Funneliformis mosseae]
KEKEDLARLISSDEPIVTQNQQWKNWSQDIVFTSKYTTYPKSLDELIFFVKKAVNEKLHIRYATEGHSWSSLSRTNSFLLALKDNLSKITAE